MPSFTKYFSDIFNNLVNSPSQHSHHHRPEIETSISDTEALLAATFDEHAQGQNTLPRSRKGFRFGASSKPSRSSAKNSSFRASTPPSYYASGTTRLRWDTENSFPYDTCPEKSRFNFGYESTLDKAPSIRAGSPPETPQRESQPRSDGNRHLACPPNGLDVSHCYSSFTASLVSDTSTAATTVSDASPGLGLSCLGAISTPPNAKAASRPMSPLPTPPSPSPSPSPAKSIGLGISCVSPERSPTDASPPFDGLGRVGVRRSSRRYATARARAVPPTWRHGIIGGFQDAVEDDESDLALTSTGDYDGDQGGQDAEDDDEIFSVPFSPPPPVRRHFLRGYEGDLFDPMASLAYDYTSPPKISHVFYEEMIHTWTLGEEAFSNHVLHSIPEEDDEYEDEDIDLASPKEVLNDLNFGVGGRSSWDSVRSMGGGQMIESLKTPQESSPPPTPLKCPELDDNNVLITCPASIEDIGTSCPPVVKSSIALIKLDLELDGFYVDLGISP